MDKIAKEIEAMAETLAKSCEDPNEILFKTIAALGKDGIKARLSLLSTEEKSLLKAALTEMTLRKSKSVEFDKESQSAKVIQGNIMDTILQEEIGSDDADEKLVKPEAAKHNHQGNSVNGWEGQVIKAMDCPGCGKGLKEDLKKCSCGYMKKGESKKSTKEQEQEDAAATAKVAITEKKGKVMKKSELVEQMNKSEDVLVKAIERMHEKGMRKKMIKKSLISVGVDSENLKKAFEKVKKEKTAKKLMAMEEKEHGTKDPKKLVEAEAKEQKMKKSSENAEQILEEEKQSGDTAQMTEDGKDLGDHLKMGKDNKKAQDDVNNTKVEGIKKSIPWNSEDALLKANTNGRNFHFDVGDYVEGMLKAQEEEMKRKKEGKPARDEGAEKDMKKADINDILEKKQDSSWFQEDMKKSLAAQEALKTGKMTKSFADEDMATLLNLTPEEAKKILG